MRIEENTKLDFSDVLIRPKRSNLSSRNDVSLERTFVFKHSPYEWSGIPIMNSNMGTCGTFEIANILFKHNCLATVHKFHDVESWLSFIWKDNPGTFNNIFFPVGMDDNSLKTLDEFTERHGSAPPLIMADVANGYTEKFVEYIRHVRAKYPTAVIVAGNVATADMTEALILAGADIVKVNIGAGSVCVHEDEIVHTKNGTQKIKDISIDDEVLTHTGEYHKVIQKFKKETTTMMEINGIRCTPDHKFLVVDKKYQECINDDNYMEYAFWCDALMLNKDIHLLIDM